MLCKGQPKETYMLCKVQRLVESMDRQRWQVRRAVSAADYLGRSCIASILTLGSAACLSLLAPSVASAQASGGVIGVSSYRMNSPGTGMIVGPYLRKAMGGPFSGVISVPFLFDTRTFEFGPGNATEVTKLLFPEVRLEVAARTGSFSPFLGVGGGIGIDLGGPQYGGVTLHALGGARLRLSPRVSITTTVIARTVRPWNGHTFDGLIGFELVRPR